MTWLRPCLTPPSRDINQQESPLIRRSTVRETAAPGLKHGYVRTETHDVLDPGNAIASATGPVDPVGTG